MLSYEPILSGLKCARVLNTRLYCLPYQKTNQLLILKQNASYFRLSIPMDYPWHNPPIMLLFWLKGRREAIANSMQMWASELQKTLKRHLFHQKTLKKLHQARIHKRRSLNCGWGR